MALEESSGSLDLNFMHSTHQATLRAQFDKAAQHYDFMVGLNPGYHRHLHDAAKRLIAQIGPNRRVLDVGCGSGASTRALVEQGAGEVLGVDASRGMLEQARRKTWPPGVVFQVATAQELSCTLFQDEANRFDGVFAAYLIRNVPEAERDAVLKSLHDALPQGASIVLVEYALGRALWPRLVWNLVCWLAVIPMATILMGDSRLFRYLWRSVHAADRPQVLTQRLQRAGFRHVRRHPVSGWQRGILHIWEANA